MLTCHIVHAGSVYPLQGRCGEIGEIGDVAVFLASDKASFITGTHISVDGVRVCARMACVSHVACRASQPRAAGRRDGVLNAYEIDVLLYSFMCRGLGVIWGRAGWARRSRGGCGTGAVWTEQWSGSASPSHRGPQARPDRLW